MARRTSLTDFFNQIASGHDPAAQLQPPGSPLKFDMREMFSSVGDFFAIAAEIIQGLFKGNFEGAMWAKIARGWTASPSDIQGDRAATGIDPDSPADSDLVEEPLLSNADRNYGRASDMDARLDETSAAMRLDFAVAAAGLNAPSPAPGAAPVDPALRNLPGLDMGRVA